MSINEIDVKKSLLMSTLSWDSDNLGDLLADGTVHIDQVCDRAIEQLTTEEKRIRYEESEKIFEEWLARNEPLQYQLLDNDF